MAVLRLENEKAFTDKTLLAFPLVVHLMSLQILVAARYLYGRNTRIQVHLIVGFLVLVKIQTTAPLLSERCDAIPQHVQICVVCPS